MQNPLRRAAHILQLNGIDVEKDGGAVKPDMATLGEVLEIQEKILDSSPQEILEIKKYLQSEIKSLLENIASKLENKDFSKYFDKILQDLRK